MFDDTNKHKRCITTYFLARFTKGKETHRLNSSHSSLHSLSHTHRCTQNHLANNEIRHEFPSILKLQ